MQAVQLIRCFGERPNQILYRQYHDTQWGVPVHDDRMLFEMLILEGAHAGLNFALILNKREGYRQAFADFDPEKLAKFSDAMLEKQLENTAIVRNRLKVFSVRKNAQVYLAIQKEYGSFDQYLKKQLNCMPITNWWQSFDQVPTNTPMSDKLAKDLKKRGMSFVGTTIIYSFLQSIGVVNDHLTSCFRHAQVTKIQQQDAGWLHQDHE